jgi:hypothetical protein
VLKVLASYSEIQRHELIPSHVTAIILPCEAGRRCVQTTVPATKLKKAVN